MHRIQNASRLQERRVTEYNVYPDPGSPAQSPSRASTAVSHDAKDDNATSNAPDISITAARKRDAWNAIMPKSSRSRQLPSSGNSHSSERLTSRPPNIARLSSDDKPHSVPVTGHALSGPEYTDPPTKGYQCEFIRFFGCTMRIKHFTGWKEHTLSHFEDKGPPDWIVCPLHGCTNQFPDREREVTLYSDNFHKYMVHIAWHQQMGRWFDDPEESYNLGFELHLRKIINTPLPFAPPPWIVPKYLVVRSKLTGAADRISPTTADFRSDKGPSRMPEDFRG